MTFARDLRNLETCSSYAQSHAKVSLVNCVSKTMVLFRNEIWLGEKAQIFITVFTTNGWVKPVWSAEPIC